MFRQARRSVHRPQLGGRRPNCNLVSAGGAAGVSFEPGAPEFMPVSDGCGDLHHHAVVQFKVIEICVLFVTPTFTAREFAIV